MSKLDPKNYCLSCEHILKEQGFSFLHDDMSVGRPISLHAKKCKRCNQLIDPIVEEIKNDYATFVTSLKNPKLKVVAFIAPSVRAGIGECFNKKGDYQLKIVTALKMLGVHDVFSMNFGADLTIIEECKEFIQRLHSGNLPLFTSCCPAWVNYVTKLYPELLPKLSTCKSPQQMMGAVINNYYCLQNNINPTDIFIVSIVPCLAKKVERLTPGINSGVGCDVDACITTTELAEIIKQNNIDFLNLPDTPFDKMFKDYSGTASAFGISGGVSESVVLNIDKTAKFKTLQVSPFVIKQTQINGKKLQIAQVTGLNNVNLIIEQIKNGTCSYALVEVMACSGGCIGGTGQPKADLPTLKSRRKILEASKKSSILVAGDNNIVKNLYNSYLIGPKAQQLLHKK